MEAVSSFKSFSLRLKSSMPLKEGGVIVESVHCQSQSQSQVMEDTDVLSVCLKSNENETKGRGSRRVTVLGLLPLPLFLETEKSIYVLRRRN